MIMIEPDEVISFVYYLDEGIASVVAQSPEDVDIEAGFIGREGFVIPGAALGADTVPNLCQVQVTGHGHRITVSGFRVAMEPGRKPSRQRNLQRAPDPRSPSLKRFTKS